MGMKCGISLWFIFTSLMTVFPCSSKCCPLSHVWLFATPWTVARQAPLSMEFSRQEYWSGLLFPSPHTSMHTHKYMHIHTYAFIHFYTYISVVWEEPKTRGRCSQEKWHNLFMKHGARAGNEQDNPGMLSIKLYLTVMQVPLEEVELFWFLKHYMNQHSKDNAWWWQRSVKCIKRRP